MCPNMIGSVLNLYNCKQLRTHVLSWILQQCNTRASWLGVCPARSCHGRWREFVLLVMNGVRCCDPQAYAAPCPACGVPLPHSLGAWAESASVFCHIVQQGGCD